MSELRIDDELPLFIQREKAATLLLEAYLGDVSAPSTASAGTFTLTRPAGTDLIAADTCGVVTHTATYALSAIASSEDFGDKWKATWAVTIGGVVYEVEQRAMLVRQVLRCPVTNATLLRYHPECSTYPAGASSWEPSAIRAAWVWTQQCLIETGMRPYKVIGADALERMTRYKALGLAFRSMSTYVGDPERYMAMALYYDANETSAPGGAYYTAPGLAQQAWAKIRPWYDADDDGIVTDDEREDDMHAAGGVC